MAGLERRRGEAAEDQVHLARAAPGAAHPEPPQPHVRGSLMPAGLQAALERPEPLGERPARAKAAQVDEAGARRWLGQRTSGSIRHAAPALRSR